MDGSVVTTMPFCEIPDGSTKLTPPASGVASLSRLLADKVAHIIRVDVQKALTKQCV